MLNSNDNRLINSILWPNFLFLFLLLLFMSALSGCDKDENYLPVKSVVGRIIGVTGMCYGDIVMIEVYNQKGLGVSGTFSTYGGQFEVSYNNAIGVPYFSKIGLPESIPQRIGTVLEFEYRELTEEERNDPNLFFSYEGGCLLFLTGPNVKRMMITKVIKYK